MRKLTYLIAVVIVAVLVLDIPAQTQSVVKQLRQGREKEQAGDLDGAIQVYQQITADTAADQRHVAQAYYRMGVCYLRNGDKDNAKKQFERLVSEFPRKLSAVANARRELKKIQRQERSEEMKRTRAGQLGRERDRNNLVSPKSPPTVVRTTPANFADNVPPTSRTISVTFNQQMMDESWSWMQFDKETFPEMVGKSHYDREKRTCALRVKLKPATAYLIGINSGTAKNFKSTTGETAKAYALVFATADITGGPTAIPEEMLARARAINGTKATKELAEPAGENLLAMVPAESLFCIRVNHFEYTLSQIDQFLAGISPVPMAASISVRTQFAKMLGSPQLAGVNMAGSFTLFGPILGTDMSDPDNIAILVPVTDYKEFVSGNPNVSQPDRNGISKITSTKMHPLLVTQVNSYALVTPQGNNSELITTAKSISGGEMTGLATALDAAKAKQAAEQPIWAYANIELVEKTHGTAISGQFEQFKMMAGAAKPSGESNTAGTAGIMNIDIEKLMKETHLVSLTITPTPNVLNMTYTMSALPGTKMENTYFTDPMAMRGLSDKLKDPKKMGAQFKPISALLPEAAEADFAGTYNLVYLLKMLLSFAPMPMPQIDVPTKSNIAFAGKVGKEAMTVDIALPKEHLAEIMAAAMMMQQKMMQTPMIGGQPAPSAIPVQPGRTIPPKLLVINPLVGMGEVSFGMTIEQARQILGEPQRMTGRACEYLDSGFTIVPGRDGTVAAIMCGDASLPDSPLIKNCKCRTDEGVGMGSSRQDVVSAYGRPSSVEEFIGMGNLVMLKYDNINAGFVLRDDKLVHMTFRKPRRPISR